MAPQKEVPAGAVYGDEHAVKDKKASNKPASSKPGIERMSGMPVIPELMRDSIDNRCVSHDNLLGLISPENECKARLLQDNLTSAF